MPLEDVREPRIGLDALHERMERRTLRREMRSRA
jgi:hypothetical protein